jgi:hypothetical protein
MQERGSKDPLCGRLPAERRLCTGRLCATTRLDFTRVTVPRQRCQLVPQRPAKQLLQPPRLNLRQLPDAEHTHLGQPRLGDRAHAPHQLHGQVVKES